MSFGFFDWTYILWGHAQLLWERQAPKTKKRHREILLRSFLCDSQKLAKLKRTICTTKHILWELLGRSPFYSFSHIQIKLRCLLLLWNTLPPSWEPRQHSITGHLDKMLDLEGNMPLWEGKSGQSTNRLEGDSGILLPEKTNSWSIGFNLRKIWSL